MSILPYRLSNFVNKFVSDYMNISEAVRLINRTNNEELMQKALDVAYAYDLECLKESADRFEDLDILTAESIVHHLLYVNSDALMFPIDRYSEDLEKYVVELKLEAKNGRKGSN